MSRPILDVLFLCTGNTARSVLAEGLLHHLGAGRFHAYSAGSQPKGVVNPFALETLAAHGCPTDGLRSKSWNELAGPGAPHMDFIFTVCDNAAGETCPYWPGRPLSAHWGIADPAAVEGTDEAKRQAFEMAWLQLRERIQAFLALPINALPPDDLARRLAGIGRMAGATMENGD